MKSKKIFIDIISNVCWPSQLDIVMLKKAIKTGTLELCSCSRDADLIILFTCAYNNINEKESIKKIKNFITKMSDKEIIVTGCLPKINPKELEDLNVNICPIDDLNKLLKQTGLSEEHLSETELYSKYNHFIYPKALDLKKIIWSCAGLLQKILKSFSLGSKGLDIITAQGYRYANDSCFVRSSWGCPGRCSYCAIRFAKAKYKSRTISSITKNIENAILNGDKNIILIADNLSAFGLDIDESFVELLDTIRNDNPLCHLFLENCEPRWLLKDLPAFIKVIKNSSIKYISTPIQSGSSKILKKMNRQYDIEEIINMLTDIKHTKKNIVICTHIMVGFPGETWKDYFQTLHFICSGIIDYVIAEGFAEKINTPAAEYFPKTNPSVKLARLFLLFITFYAVLFKKFFSFYRA